MSPGMTHFPLASTTCAAFGTRTSARGPMARICPASTRIAAFRIAGRPVAVITVAPWITIASLGCCARRVEADARHTRIRLIFHVFMLAFLKKDLDPLLGDERKHDKRTQRIAPS